MNARDYVMKTAEEKMVKHGGFGIDSLARTVPGLPQPKR